MEPEVFPFFADKGTYKRRIWAPTLIRSCGPLPLGILPRALFRSLLHLKWVPLRGTSRAFGLSGLQPDQPLRGAFCGAVAPLFLNPLARFARRPACGAFFFFLPAALFFSPELKTPPPIQPPSPMRGLLSGLLPPWVLATNHPRRLVRLCPQPKACV